MKRTLKEELERIHSLTYGNTITEGDNVMDKILSKLGIKSTEKKVDEPKKADYVSSNVNDFFNTLEQSANSGGLSQQVKGSMTYQKTVEAMQIGLMLLGYQLPKHGVDGLFGPETANAVRKFMLDNKILNESAEELRGTLDDLGYSEKGNELSSGGDISNNISGIVSNILKDFKKSHPNVKVTVTAGNDRYHKKLSYNSKHKTGDAVDVVINPYNSANSAGFLSILNKYAQSNSNFKYIDEYKNPSKGSTGGHYHLQYGGSSVTPKNQPSTKQMVTATPQMLLRLIELLKNRGVKPEELQGYVDKTVKVFDGNENNVFTKILELLGAPVTEENIKFLTAWRQAEGKGGKNNPFNTTYKLPNSTNFNKAKVKNYETIQDGITATVKTLQNSRYRCIVEGLKNNIGSDNIAKCDSLRIWGTGDLVAKVLNSYKKGNQPKIEPLV